ncbi:MAG: hypothetical protein HY466_01830 [Deltaproteobacteria bacterium]|nr:hypothetical protein [Deltaproteobacteria bacterium]
MAKIRKQFILDSRKISRAKKVLGAATETETINIALDILLANAEIASLHEQLAGRVKIKNMDQSTFHG